MVLLTVGTLFPNAYGVAVMDEIAQQANRRLNISAVHSVLTRLEGKGYLVSKLGESPEERGGRRKRIFTLTAAGKTVLEETYALRNHLFHNIGGIALDLKFI